MRWKEEFIECYEIDCMLYRRDRAVLGTGFAGMSAAAVISPMLITFLHIPAYEAVGIALSSDVLASAAQRLYLWEA